MPCRVSLHNSAGSFKEELIYGPRISFMLGVIPCDFLAEHNIEPPDMVIGH